MNFKQQLEMELLNKEIEQCKFRLKIHNDKLKNNEKVLKDTLELIETKIGK